MRKDLLEVELTSESNQNQKSFKSFSGTMQNSKEEPGNKEALKVAKMDISQKSFYTGRVVIEANISQLKILK